jgi:hypothetical protein
LSFSPEYYFVAHRSSCVGMFPCFMPSVSWFRFLLLDEAYLPLYSLSSA